MRIMLIYFMLFISSYSFAETEMDRQLRVIGIVGADYKKTNKLKYIEFWKDVSKDMANLMPLYLDKESRILTMSISENLFINIMQIDTNVKEFKPETVFIDSSKVNFCNSNYGKSKVIRSNGGITVTLMVVNSQYQTIFSNSFSSLGCPSQ